MLDLIMKWQTKEYFTEYCIILSNYFYNFYNIILLYYYNNMVIFLTLKKENP